MDQDENGNIGLYLARYGVWVVLSGLFVILGAFVVSVLVFRPEAADVSTALAPVTGVVGTLVGAYFGVQIGAQGRQQAEAATARAQEQVLRLATVADPHRASQLFADDPARRGSS